MKRISIIVLLFALAFVCNSCSEDDSSPLGPGDLVSGEVSATIDGKSWKSSGQMYFNAAKIIAATKLENLATYELTTISISFLLSGNEPAVGTGTAQCFYQESEGVPPSSSVKTWANISGTYEFTEVTATQVKGTFEFTGTNIEDNSTKTVKGAFNVPRQ